MESSWKVKVQIENYKLIPPTRLVKLKSMFYTADVMKIQKKGIPDS